MKRILFGVLVALFAISISGPSTPTAAASATTVYASDSFSRTVQNQWGSANQGGAYSISGTTSSFRVNGSEGTIRLGSAPARSALLNNLNVLDSSTRVRFKTDKLPQGAPQFVYIIARQTAAGTAYLGQVRLPPDGSVRLRAGIQQNGKTTMLGTEVRVSGITHTAGRAIYVRLKVVGTNPTTIQMRAWYAGKTEPSAVQYTATDNTSALQHSGAIGIRVRTKAKATNLPYVFSFDDLVAETAVNTNLSGAVYWGALVNGQAPSPGNLAPGGVFDTFEQHAGKKMSILHWGAPWKYGGTYLPFQTSYYTAVRNRGYIPFVDWSSWNLGSGINQSNFQLADIYNGAHDDYIKQWAQDAKAWGHPFFLRFDWEMNGDWQFSWSEKLNGNKPGDYVKMWRHVHDIVKQQGANNISWVWCPNIASSGTTPMSSLYPGDAYVDWICLDGYNKYSTWLEFNQVFGADGINWLHNSYKEITNIAPNKPLVIGEVASLEAGDGGAKKAAWIKNAFLDQIPNRFPKIQAVLWFNWNDGSSKYTFPIESSSASQNAFAQGIGSDYYAANDFSNLNTSPIPPLH